MASREVDQANGLAVRPVIKFPPPSEYAALTFRQRQVQLMRLRRLEAGWAATERPDRRWGT